MFTKSDVGFMRARSPAVTRPRVASISRRCSDSTSDSSKSAALLGATAWPSSRAFAIDASRPQASTFMPNALP